MAVIPRDPLGWLVLFRQQINEIFSFLSTVERGGPGEKDYAPLVDIFETADAFVVEVEFPGFDRSDLSLNICCNTLVIQGMKREEKVGHQVSYICLERRFGRFLRTVEIPPGVDVDGIQAKYRSGLLRVSFPKMEEKGSIVRNVPIV